MAVKTLVTLDEYLATSYEGTDREYIQGEVIERSMPTCDHGEMQMHWGVIIHALKLQGLPLRAVSEVRHRVSAERIRVPDVAIFAGPRPEGRVPTIPPLAAIEILSPDDRIMQLLDKLREYDSLGIAHIWLIDPEKRKLYSYSDGNIIAVREFTIPEYLVTISHETIFSI